MDMQCKDEEIWNFNGVSTVLIDCQLHIFLIAAIFIFVYVKICDKIIPDKTSKEQVKIAAYINEERAGLPHGQMFVKKLRDIPLLRGMKIVDVFHHPHHASKLILIVAYAFSCSAKPENDEILIYDTKTMECKPFEINHGHNSNINFQNDGHYYPFESFEKQMKSKILETKNYQVVENDAEQDCLYQFKYKMFALDHKALKIDVNLILIIGRCQWQLYPISTKIFEFVTLFDLNTMTVNFETMIVDEHLFHSNGTKSQLTPIRIPGANVNQFPLDRWASGMGQYLLYKNWLLLTTWEVIYVYYIPIKTINNDNDDDADHCGNGKNYRLGTPIFTKRIFVPSINICNMTVLDSSLPFMNKIQYTQAFSSVRTGCTCHDKYGDEKDEHERTHERLRLLIIGHCGSSVHKGRQVESIFRNMAVYLQQSLRLINICLTKHPVFANKNTIVTEMFPRRETSCSNDGVGLQYDTFGVKLAKNKKFWKCFEDKWLEYCSVLFVKNRYIMFIGGTINTNGIKTKYGMWNTVKPSKMICNFGNIDRLIDNYNYNEKEQESAENMQFLCDESLRMVHIQRFDQYAKPIDAQRSQIIIFDFVKRKWKYVNVGSTLRQVIHPWPVLMNNRDINMFAPGARSTKPIIQMSMETSLKEIKSFDCFKLTFETSKWDIERLIWIGYEKNEDNPQCQWPKLPKDIVTYILKLSKFSIFDDNDEFVRSED